MAYNPFAVRRPARVGQLGLGPFPGPSGTSGDPLQAATFAAAAAAGQGGACRIRRAILGLQQPAAVPAGDPLTSVTQPQKPFRGLRLVVPSDIAGAFVISNITVGMMPQLGSSSALQPIPARLFAENSVDSAFDDFDWCPTSESITVSGTNVSGAAETFRAALLGLVLES
jgi:hypothetical protein